MAEIDKIESVIGPSLVVKGDIQSSGALRVDGVVEGSISSKGTVVVANNGTVKADIKADRIIIGGNIQGNVIAREKVEILSTGKLRGNITTVARGFIVHEGANFEGACKTVKTEELTEVRPKAPLGQDRQQSKTAKDSPKLF